MVYYAYPSTDGQIATPTDGRGGFERQENGTSTERGNARDAVRFRKVDI
jgi:hypothetical protein